MSLHSARSIGYEGLINLVQATQLVGVKSCGSGVGSLPLLRGEPPSGTFCGGVLVVVEIKRGQLVEGS